MKRYLLKLSIFASIIIILSLIINFCYLAKKNWDPDGVKKYESMPESIEICNFGSSHGQNGICYENLDNSAHCFNYANGGQTLSYDYRLLKYYSGNLEEGAVVYITLSYHSLFRNEETKDANFASRNRKYYRILPKELIKEYDLKTNFYIKYIPGLISYEDLLGTFGLDTGKKEVSWTEKTTSEQAKKYSITRAAEHITSYLVEGERVLNLEEYNSLISMIDLCYAEGFVPILITTPFLQEYNEAVSKEDPTFFATFYDIIENICNDKSVSYFDYSHDIRFSNNYNLFMNADHLNKSGALLFTELLLNETLLNTH